MGNIEFCETLGKSASETFEMTKQVYGKEALVRGAVFKWHKRFAQGRDSLEDDEHAGRPRRVRTELKIQEVAMLMHANSSQTATLMAAEEEAKLEEMHLTPVHPACQD
jgi:hypothetical protein